VCARASWANGTVNQIHGFLIERGIIVRQGVVPLRKALPDILSSNINILTPRMVSLIAGWTSALTSRPGKRDES
jgi:hypothetical protein